MAKRTKGLSFEEKRARLADLFYETKDFWTLKELEKMGSKQKGIVSQSIKEVLDSLVSDSMVTLEKIGTGNYYWAFPSTAGQVRTVKLKDLTEDIQKALDKKERLAKDLAGAKSLRPETQERIQQLERLSYLRFKKQSLLQELESYKDRDPETLEKKKRGAIVAKEAANRWTDNIFILQSYCSSKFMIPSAQFCSQFGIPEDLDSV